jgi:hypothetical protein
MTRVLALMQPFRLSEKEELELLSASQKNDYPLDAVLTLGMHSSRESLLTKTVFEIAVPQAQNIRAEHFGGFFQVIVAKACGISCAEHHVLLRALAQLCSRGLFTQVHTLFPFCSYDTNERAPGN